MSEQDLYWCWKCQTKRSIPNQILCASCLREATLLMERLIDTRQLVFAPAPPSSTTPTPPEPGDAT